MRWVSFSALLLGAAGCSRPARPSAWLVDATADAGIDFRHSCGPERGYYLPEIMGSGCALFDADGDGDLDAYLVNAGTPPLADGTGGTASAERAPNRLYLQEAPLVFVDATAASGTGDAGYGMGVAAGDVEGDGDVDLYLTNVGANVLFQNEGDARFLDVTRAAGVGHAGWSSSAAFVDLDLDGDLDLWVASYLELDPAHRCRDGSGRLEYCGPTEHPAAADVFYENRGDGAFVDASARTGIALAPRRGLGVAAADLSGDGRVDVFVANDNDPNQLWVLGAGGRLVDEALARGLAYDAGGREEAGMGVACTDVDADGDLDLVLSHLAGESDTVYVQVRPGTFRDDTARLGLAAETLAATGFGLGAADLDHDGRVDLLQLNGHVTRGSAETAGGFWDAYAQPASLYVGTAAGPFASVDPGDGPLAVARVGRGLALGDVDRDGDVDALVTAVAGPARLLRNDAGRGHWLSVRAVDAGGGDALGATVVVEAGGRRRAACIPTGTSYLSSSAPCAHFGLGAAGTVDAIHVRWPDGAPERFPGGPADRERILARGGGG